MPLAQEKRCRGQIEPGPCAGDRQQRVHILVARSRDLDHLAIHYLLARQTDLAEQPPDRGMEPEDAANDFLGQGEEPVVTAHVQDFVAQDGFLYLTRRSSEKFAGSSTTGCSRPKVTGLEIASETRISASTLQVEHGIERQRVAA